MLFAVRGAGAALAKATFAVFIGFFVGLLTARFHSVWKVADDWLQNRLPASRYSVSFWATAVGRRSAEVETGVAASMSYGLARGSSARAAWTRRKGKTERTVAKPAHHTISILRRARAFTAATGIVSAADQRTDLLFHSSRRIAAKQRRAESVEAHSTPSTRQRSGAPQTEAMATMLLQSPQEIKSQFQAWDQQLASRESIQQVARQVAQSARRQQTFDGANLAPTLTYWSEMLRVATTRSTVIKKHLDAGAVLGGVDTSTRGALGVVRGKLAGGSTTADATRSARVVLFLVKQYAGLAAILGAPPPGRAHGRLCGDALRGAPDPGDGAAVGGEGRSSSRPRF